jgi:ubiquinone/menaquinone biosynthesis C-methylase UbiE
MDDRRDNSPGLTAAEAKRFYDSIGKKQDVQFYENRALKALISYSDFHSARSVFEFGCGTGRFAVELLTRHLSEECTYRGIDISGTMTGLCKERLAGWRNRASVELVSGAIRIDAADNTYDRFISTYVFDLLSGSDMREVMHEAYRVLRPGGLLCVVSLTRGDTPFCRVVSSAWTWLFRYRPYWVGGCRPIDVGRSLDKTRWDTVHDEVISAFGISSEVLVARAVGKAV